jgi:hypothetical protein
MACRHGLNEDCEPCEARFDVERHLRKGERPCTNCRTWLGREYPHEECQDCRLESGSAKWCDRCEDVVIDAPDECCAPCQTIRDNAAEESWMRHENDKLFGGSRS